MSNRANVRMTPGEIRAFVASRRCAVVCGLAPDGRLVMRVVSHKLVGERLVLDPVAAAPLVGTPVCAIVDTYPGGRAAEIKGALIHGQLAVEGSAAVLALNSASGFDFAKESKAGSGGL
jgi:hypothetical protein